MDRNPVIDISNLSFRYGRGPLVLEDVSVRVENGDFASVIGPNGGGKTTLIKLVVGLLTPTTGEIQVLGQSPERARPRIGYMPQHTAMDSRFPILVHDVVMMGRLRPGLSFGSYSRSDQRAASEVLVKVGLEDLQSRPFSALSGGQRQRVLLARALATEPELLLLDEPAANLDQKVEKDFFDLLQELNQHLTIVLVSHDLGFVSGFVRSVICVHRTVDMHPTSALDGRAISDIYGGEVRLVHHDHRITE